jgi:hypothetical protein
VAVWWHPQAIWWQKPQTRVLGYRAIVIETPFPTPRNDDAEDVAWGLTTGGALWRQGERYDAIIWLKRAVEAATDAGASDRADELNRATTELMAILATPTGPGRRSPLPSAPKISTPKPPPLPPHASPAPPKPVSSRPNLPAYSVASGVEVLSDVGGGRAPMPSVTTSAPPLETLTRGSAASQDAGRRVSPPPPTIQPEFSSSPPTPRFPSPLPGSAHNASPVIDASLLAALSAIAELTDDQKRDLAATAVLEKLASEEDVTIGGLALVIEGRAGAQATVADVTAVALNQGELLYARSSIPDSLSIRLVAESEPTTVATWEARVADDILASTPELLEKLKRISDRIQAIAGCMIGAMGERLDDAVRGAAIDKLLVRALKPHDLIAEAGQPVPGMVIIGVGSVDLAGKNGKGQRLGPGEFLFAGQVLGGGLAPTTARAGAKGAIVLYGGRAITHELIVTCPPLVELLAGF